MMPGVGGTPIVPSVARARRLARYVFLAVSLVALAAALSAVIFLWPWLYGITHNPFSQERFNRQKWLTAHCLGRPESNPRGPMAEDVRRRLVRVGMTRAELHRLLGPSDNSQADDEEGDVDNYLLGCWGWIAIDPSYLSIHYDESGRLVSTDIWES